MAKSTIPITMQSRHSTKAEIKARKEAEDQIKGNDDLVYVPPKNFNKEEKEVYKFLISELYVSNILSNLDIVILEQTVECIIKMKQIKKETSTLDLFEQKDFTSMYREFFSMYLKCCNELGLSPASRAKMANAKVQAKVKLNDPLLNIRDDD